MENEFKYLISGPEHQQEDFLKAMQSFPDFTMQPVGDEVAEFAQKMDLQATKNAEWAPEKDALVAMMEGVEIGISKEDPVVLKGFVDLHKGCESKMALYQKNRRVENSLENFVNTSVRIFQHDKKILETVEKDPRFESTTKSGKVHFNYRDTGTHLSPRMSRILIRRYGLDGNRRKPIYQLASEEGVTQATAMNANLALAQEVWRILSKLPV